MSTSPFDSSRVPYQVETYQGRPWQMQSCHYVLLRNYGKNLPRICRCTDRQRSNTSTVAYAEQHPPIKKCHQVALDFAQIYVLTARIREHRSQFGECRASE